MTFRKFLAAGLCALAFAFAVPQGGSAETVRVMEGSAQAPLKVPLNRAVVVESDVAFAELSVANPLIADIATLSERTIYVLGKAPGRTTLTLLGADGRLITNIEVQVSPDIAEIKERLSELLPGEGIEVRTANDGLVLSGTVSSTARLTRALDVAERYAPGAVLNLMVVGGVQQVMLKVRFAEMQRSVRKELDGALGITRAAGSASTTSGTLSGGTANATATSPGLLSLSIPVSNLTFNPVINALEDKGLVRTLAEPSLSALSGQEASFLAGGEIPIPVVTGTGADQQVSVDFRNVGIELGFTPTVVDGDIINLFLDASVSRVDAANSRTINGNEVFGFSTRETSTTVELRDGQSFSIAGLLEDNFFDGVGQVPWLGDLPVLGLLFRSANYDRRQTELVIIVTAHLVQPTSGEALALPTDRIRPPTESELFLFGRIAGPASGDVTSSTRGTATSEVETQDFTGSYGYVME